MLKKEGNLPVSANRQVERGRRRTLSPVSQQRPSTTINKAEKVWRNVHTFSSHTPGYPFEVHFGILLPNVQDPILTACDFPLIKETLKTTITDLVSLFTPFPNLTGNVGFIAYEMLPGGKVDLFIKYLEDFSFYDIKKEPLMRQYIQQLRTIQQQVIDSIPHKTIKRVINVERSWTKQFYSAFATLSLIKSNATNEDKIDHLLPISPENRTSDTHFFTCPYEPTFSRLSRAASLRQ